RAEHRLHRAGRGIDLHEHVVDRRPRRRRVVHVVRRAVDAAVADADDVAGDRHVAAERADLRDRDRALGDVDLAEAALLIVGRVELAVVGGGERDVVGAAVADAADAGDVPVVGIGGVERGLGDDVDDVGVGRDREILDDVLVGRVERPDGHDRLGGEVEAVEHGVGVRVDGVRVAAARAAPTAAADSAAAGRAAAAAGATAAGTTAAAVAHAVHDVDAATADGERRNQDQSQANHGASPVM